MTREEMADRIGKIAEIQTTAKAIRRVREESATMIECIDRMMSTHISYEFAPVHKNLMRVKQAESDVFLQELVLEAVQERLIKLIEVNHDNG